jgi:predicted enzyme related to lactoylglutathione lyase
MSTAPKTFVWYELMTTDVKAAEAFYRSVVGWTSQAWGEPGAYTLMKAGEAMIAGIMTLPKEVCDAGGRPGWVGYVGVDNVDAATAGVRKAGGTVHREPADIPDVGRFAVVADPGGATFMLFTPKGGDGTARDQMAPGHVGWHELYAADWQKAFDFYAGQFGWTKADAMDMGPMGTYQLFAAGGAPIGGMMNKPDAVPMPVWLFYFNVPEIDAAVTSIRAGGGQVVNGPMEVPGGAWIVQATDPQGAMFALVGPRR